MDDSGERRIETLEREILEERLREASRGQGAGLDDLELHHLVRVITECSLLLTDVYSEERLVRIMHPERGFLASLVSRLIEQERRGEGEVLYRVRRLPEDVRLVGDKALFDLGLLGRRQVKGYDIEELGARAYRMAGEALELLAEDRRLREFFKQNRLLMLPLEEEVVFLNQCSDKFRHYAGILQQSRSTTDSSQSAAIAEIASRVPLMAAAAAALTAVEPSDDYLLAARGDLGVEATTVKERLLSSYERLLLFAAVDVVRLESALNATVIDQAAAVHALCDEFSLYAAGTRDQRKPPAYFLVGPTGVGKNHLVESLGRLLQGVWQVEIPMLTIEGPNYTYPSDINELRGATRGFIRSDEEGLLARFHERSSVAPVGVILIDEVEKAHPHLLTFFLSILDRGTTVDNKGEELNFANCMMFFTSNLGYSDAQQGAAPIGYHDEVGRQQVADRDIRRSLRRALKPEFINRVRLIHFERLSPRSAERILYLEFDRIAARYREVHGLQLELAPSAREELVRTGFSPDFGARHLAAMLESVCNVEIAKKVRRDDRRTSPDRAEVLSWLREMREGRRPYEPEAVRRRVLDLARAELDYGKIRVSYVDGVFRYEGNSTEDPP